jgi:hypothetical protein
MTSHDSDGLWSLARGNLSAADAARLRVHVSECAECARTLTSMEASAALLATHAVPAPAPELWSRVDRGVLAGAEKALSGSAKRAWLRWGLLGGVAALAVVGLLVLRVPSPVPMARHEPALQPEPVPPPAPAPGEVTQVLAKLRIGSAEQALGRGDQLDTPPGVEARLSLQGAEVRVQPETRLAIAELDAQRSRLVLSRGTVEASSRTHELVIHALQVDIVVAGSACVVRADERGALQVAVRDGMVRVRAGGEERELAAGGAVMLQNGRWQLRAPVSKERLVPQSQPAPRVEPAPEPPTPSVSPDAGVPASGKKPAAPRGDVRVIRNRLPFAVQPETLDKVLPQPGR